MKNGAPSPISILRDLKSGQLPSSSLSKESRIACVEHLDIEGYSLGEIAEVLQVSTRTVRRDRACLREALALERDPELVGQRVGQLVHHAEQTIQRLRRITRQRDCPPAVRVDAERASWTIAKELVESLQRLGYLPTAAQEIRADLTHRIDEAPRLEHVAAEVTRIFQVHEQAGHIDESARARFLDLTTQLSQVTSPQGEPTEVQDGK